MRLLCLLTLMLSLLITPIVSVAADMHVDCQHGEITSDADVNKHHCCEDMLEAHHCASTNCDCDLGHSGSLALPTIVSETIASPITLFNRQTYSQRLAYQPTSIYHPPSHLR